MSCRHSDVWAGGSPCELRTRAAGQQNEPSSFRKSLLKRRPLGSFPMKRCTYSVPWSCTAMAYFRGLTHDCRQKGTLVSPTVCLGKDRGQWKVIQIKQMNLSSNCPFYDVPYINITISSMHCIKLGGKSMLRAAYRQFKNEPGDMSVATFVRPQCRGTLPTGLG